MNYTEAFEFEVRLRSKRLVYVTGEADVVDGCDCGGGDLHRHVSDIRVGEVLQLWDAGTIEGHEITPNSREMQEIEREAERHLYSVSEVS
jgi:hypothetical protein